MKNFFRRAAVLAAAAVMSVSVCSCGKDDHSHSHAQMVGDGNGNADKDELSKIYGVNMTKLKKDVPIEIEYDRNFLSEDEGRLLSNYLSAVCNADAELYKSVSYEPAVNDIVAVKESGGIDVYIKGLHDSIGHYAGKEYDFSFIVITDSKEEDSPHFDAILKDTAPDAVITSKKLVTVDVYYDTPEAKECSLYSKMGDYIYFYVYTIDGKPYMYG